ncbi:hypothetical protein [Tenacibaculum sp. M341]|uniref:hypothetical protein n=1 Tax=Tenacibaculum sp. M341 TaxID=2530339 RepID=UPI001049892E|nr:hypothetical protein [Tenacibaculum sp. M341]TCI92138.1 hypothetical protein EYW44_08115 [Tenacibaculum sp. M341]
MTTTPHKAMLIVALLVSFNIISQSLSDTQMLKLDELRVDTNDLNLRDETIRKDLNRILTLETKRKTNKTLGIIFTAASAVSFLSGCAVVSEGNGSSDIFGGLLITSGIVSGGVSIPFWVSSRHRKLERDYYKTVIGKSIP